MKTKRKTLALMREWSANGDRIHRKLLTAILRNDSLSEFREPIRTFSAQGSRALLDYADSISGAVHPDAERHYSQNQLVAFIKKYPFKEGYDTRAPALEKFLEAESKCESFNQTLRNYEYETVLLERAYRYIRRVLGDSPYMEKIYDKCDFGPGASVGVSGNDCTFARKISSDRITVTPSAKPYVTVAMYHNHHIREYFSDKSSSGIYCSDFDAFRDKIEALYDEVPYNKITFVPKTAMVDRTIAIEPLGNSFIQKGVDTYMKERMKRVGLDLRFQEPNQVLARVGSIDGSFATIDLSSASDTISIGIVKRLLPPNWFDLLNCIRSPSYKLEDGITRRYSKFSSMGNGFTFPLETLIFASFVKAVRPDYKEGVDFRVYGDDIIVRTEGFEDVIRLLTSTGFTPNLKKTFSEGFFRESCGADWFRGVDVRPMQLDYSPSTVVEVIRLHNTIRRNQLWRSFVGDDFLNYLRKIVPEKLRLVSLHSTTVEGAFEVDLDEVMTSTHCYFCRSEWRWKSKEYQLTPISSRYAYKQRAFLDYIAVLRGSPSKQLHALRRKTRTTISFK